MMLMGAFGGAIGAWATGSALTGVALAILCGAAIETSLRSSLSPIARTTWSRVSPRIFSPQG